MRAGLLASPARAHELIDTTVEGRPAAVLVSPAHDLRAVVTPDLAMLCSSLASGGEELLGLPASVSEYAERGAATGIPLLHPWANRLGGGRIAGLEGETVDPASPLVPVDERGLPIHGLRLVDAGWRVVDRHASVANARISARLDFPGDGELGRAFPFPHELTVTAALSADTLTIRTGLRPTGDRPVPVSFGWHPYFRLPEIPRADWRVALPVRRRAILDPRGLPTGEEAEVDVADGPLGGRTYDDLFTRLEEAPVFALHGGGRRIEVAFGEGYPIAQVFAPADRAVIAFEPM